MKTKTTYEASIDIAIPENVNVYVKMEPLSFDEMVDTHTQKPVLVILAMSEDSLAGAKAAINDFVNVVMEAERT